MGLFIGACRKQRLEFCRINQIQLRNKRLFYITIKKSKNTAITKTSD